MHLKTHPWSYYVSPHPLLTAWSNLLSLSLLLLLLLPFLTLRWHYAHLFHQNKQPVKPFPCLHPFHSFPMHEEWKQGLPHNLQSPCVIWPLAAHLGTTLSRAAALLPFSLFFSIPSMLQPEALCAHCFLSLDIDAATLSLQSGLREPFQTTLSGTALLQFLPLFMHLFCFRFLHSFNLYLILYHICQFSIYLPTWIETLTARHLSVLSTAIFLEPRTVPSIQYVLKKCYTFPLFSLDNEQGDCFFQNPCVRKAQTLGRYILNGHENSAGDTGHSEEKSRRINQPR